MKNYKKYIITSLLVGMTLSVSAAETPAAKVDTEEAKKTASVKKEKVVTLSHDTVVWAYEARAELPSTDKKLAEYVSSDYSNAEDEFERQELLEKIKPIIKKRIQEASKQEVYTIVLDKYLNEYDFQQKGFPTEVGEGSFVTHGNVYATLFANPEGLDFIRVNKEDAKKLMKSLTNRKYKVEITGTIDAVKEMALNGYRYKTIQLWPTKMVIYGGKNQKEKVWETSFEE